ncbi:hypothetical protein [Sporosarcina aquimarina]|uniref:Uncharacterized protein n=1 Tax=Sporosarcina aquimarina TaxID=114975 RepID=A0ABU4FXG8_9BACL|nr:hypothetical protein [Sporosarcina aquimarina]MDW0108773.1 hypothetical protein [Sporosarcina aquimarina]
MKRKQMLTNFQKMMHTSYTINDKLLVNLVLSAILFVILAVPTVFGYMILYLSSLTQFIPALFAGVLFLFSAFVLYNFNLLNTKRRVRTFVFIVILLAISAAIWPIYAAWSN